MASGVGGRYPWFCQEGSSLRPRRHYSWPQEAKKLIKTDQGQNVAALLHKCCAKCCTLSASFNVQYNQVKSVLYCVGCTVYQG